MDNSAYILTQKRRQLDKTSQKTALFTQMPRAFPPQTRPAIRRFLACEFRLPYEVLHNPASFTPTPWGGPAGPHLLVLPPMLAFTWANC